MAAVNEIRPEKSKKFEDISLSARTVVRRIENISTNMFNKLKKNSSQFEYFSLALDESNDITSTTQLMIFNNNYSIKTIIMSPTIITQWCVYILSQKTCHS